MSIEELRGKTVSDLDEYITQVENKQLVFAPSFDKTLVLIELLSEKLNSDTLNHFLILIRGKLENQIGSELYAYPTFLTDLQQLRQIVSNIVGK